MTYKIFKRASPSVFLMLLATKVYAATNTQNTANNSEELKQLMGIAGKAIAFCLILGVVFSIFALVKAGYAVAVEDNPHQAKERLRRALAGAILMAIAVPFVAFIWMNFFEPYGYTIPKFNP